MKTTTHKSKSSVAILRNEDLRSASVDSAVSFLDSSILTVVVGLVISILGIIIIITGR